MNRLYPGRLRDKVTFLRKGEADDWGVPSGETILGSLRANVRMVSGDQLTRFGAQLGTDVITVLTMKRDYVESGLQLQWNGRGNDLIYEITNVRPDDQDFEAMIITATREAHGDN